MDAYKIIRQFLVLHQYCLHRTIHQKNSQGIVTHYIKNTQDHTGDIPYTTGSWHHYHYGREPDANSDVPYIVRTINYFSKPLNKVVYVTAHQKIKNKVFLSDGAMFQIEPPTHVMEHIKKNELFFRKMILDGGL